MKTLGTAACPPYHIAFVIGGTSAEACLKTVKLASDRLLRRAADRGERARPGVPRPGAGEEAARRPRSKLGIGAQFGGKYFAHDVRVVRLPRHGASCPVGMGVSCSADRNVKAKITRTASGSRSSTANPGRFIPDAVPRQARARRREDRPRTGR